MGEALRKNGKVHQVIVYRGRGETSLRQVSAAVSGGRETGTRESR